MPPSGSLPECWLAVLIISVSPKVFPAEENSRKASSEYDSERSWQIVELVCEKFRMSHVTPKGTGINLLHQTKH